MAAAIEPGAYEVRWLTPKTRRTSYRLFTEHGFAAALALFLKHDADPNIDHCVLVADKTFGSAEGS